MIDVESVREIALSFEGTESLPHFELESFRFKNKIFATLDVKNNRAMVRLSLSDQSLFSLHDSSIIYPVPNAWGKQGATYVELSKVRKTVFREAIKAAYKLVSKKIK